MTTPAEDEFTELRDADIPRVDLVDKAANGLRFLIAKQEGGAGLMDPAFVRDLIGKSEPPPDDSTEKVTMTGSPGAIARLIHEAAARQVTKTEEATYEQIVKAKYNADDLRRMAANGQAMDDESYPIADLEDLDRAIRAVGRGGADHDAIRRHIIRRAKALGASSEIPDNWAADGSLKEGSVSKEMDDDALDPMTTLAEPDGDAPGMDTDPGSPAWEAVDAATARKWTSILARAKSAIDLLADREMLEAAAGDEDDAEKAFCLQDACCAIDYAISVLAPFAVAEQAEADRCDDMQMVGKALAAFDTSPLDTIESLAQVRKAGRVLSASNEAAIRGAVDSLQKVLASLPAAPTVEEESGRTVAKTAHEEPNMPEPTLSEDVTAASGQEPAMGTQQAPSKSATGAAVTDIDVAKADGEKPQMVAVYDKKGNLVGIVDPEKITTIAGAEADEEDESPDADSEPATPETTDLTPAPAAEVGTPADAVPDDKAVTKSDNPTETGNLSEMFKSSILAAVDSVIKEHSANQAQTIAKTGDAVLELVELVETLKGRVGALEEQPAEPKVFTNGAVPPPHMLRGQDRGAPAVDVTKAAELKKTLYRGTAPEQNQAAVDMQTAAIAALQEIHQRRAPQ